MTQSQERTQATLDSTDPQAVTTKRLAKSTIHRQEPDTDEPSPACGKSNEPGMMRRVSRREFRRADDGRLCQLPNCFGDEQSPPNPAGVKAECPLGCGAEDVILVYHLQKCPEGGGGR